MPLLISSRMTSAGLTASSSASSLTVMVVGSSIAPRSRGSATWTCDGTPLPSRRGGLRGPRRPRVPLLLLATGSSFVNHRHRSLPERLAELGRDRCLERAPQGATLGGNRPAAGIAAEVGSPAGQPAGFVHLHLAVRGSDDADQVTLGACRPAGNTRARRDAPRGQPRPGATRP